MTDLDGKMLYYNEYSAKIVDRKPEYIGMDINVSMLGSMAGTLMAIDPDMPKVNRFITLGGEAYLIRLFCCIMHHLVQNEASV